MKRAAPRRRIGIIGYEGINAIDLSGPAEAFASANDFGPVPDPYEVVVIGLDRKPFRADSGISFMPDVVLPRTPDFDTLVVPGGSGLRSEQTNSVIARWISRHADSFRRIASVCTGIYGLAPTGLLDGRKVTTHWRFAGAVAERFPKLRVDRAPLYLRDGKFYTSAGVTAGIDLALALIEEDRGQKTALFAARDLVVYLKRPGGQEQFSAPLQFQIDAADRFSDLAAWIVSHLHEDLTVERLAEQARLGTRHFGRAFTRVFGRPPAAFVEELRLTEASRRLADTQDTIDRIGASVGFSHPDTFRRSFQRRFRVAPSAFRRQFEPSLPPSS